MVFPNSDRILFEQNPLTNVICQLRFPPILRIAGDPAGFQERVRDHYPLYQLDSGVPAEVSQLMSNAGLSNIAGDLTHKFSTLDQLAQLSVSKTFVAASTESYTTWEDFKAEINRAMTAVSEEFRPSFFERIGLRYVDTIDRDALGLSSLDWSELIRKEFLGPIEASDVGGSVSAFRAQAHFKLQDVENSIVQVRYGLDDAAKCFFIDADYFVTGQKNADEVSSDLDIFNRIAGNLFRWAILPRLRDALGATQR